MHATATASTTPRATRHRLRIRAPWHGAAASLAILRRELLVTLRGWRSGLVLAVMIVAAAFVLLENWPPPETNFSNIGNATVLILAFVSVALVGASYLTLPGLAGTSLLAERQHETLDFLKLTLIPPVWVVVAKMFSCIGFFLLLLTAIVPVVAGTFFLIGADVFQFLSSIALLTIHLFACTAASLAVSATVRRPVAAIGLSYSVTALLSVIPFAMMAEYMNFGSEGLAAVTCPAFGVVYMLVGQMEWGEYLLAVLIQAILFTTFFVFTVYRLRRPERSPLERQDEIVDDPAILEARRKTFPFYLVDPLRRRPEIPDDKNPMRIKELRWGMLGREARMIRLCYVTTTIMFFTSLFLADRAPTWVLVQFAVVLMLAPAFIASAVSKEYEYGNMDLMRLTLLDGRALLHGKLWAGALSLAPVLTGLFLGGIPMVVAHLFIFGGVDFAAPRIVIWFYPLLLAFTAVVLGIGLLSSVLWRRTAAATVCSYLLASAILFASPVTMEFRDMAVSLNQSDLARDLYAFLTPLGFTLRYHPSQGSGFILTNSGRIALQFCVLAGMGLFLVRVTELIFVRRRMQDR